MYYGEFFHFLRKWREAERFPPLSAWPKRIDLDKAGWEGVQKLHYLTGIDDHEYETSFFYLEGKTFLTTPLRGEKHSVNANHTLQVKYSLVPRSKSYQRLVYLDGEQISKSPVSSNDIRKQTEIGFLFNVHSHPVHYNYNGQPTYSFFSDTDIRTLLSSKSMVSGLVTDQFWLVGKTDQVISQIGEVGVNLLREISEHAFSGEQYLDGIIKQNMARWGLVFYKSEFGKMLERVN
ncbi:MAG: hypothetical protein ACOCXP_02905 [Candidatus Dojkabacteria bacterium]